MLLSYQSLLLCVMKYIFLQGNSAKKIIIYANIRW
jgi:hypothetical protein